MEVVEMSDQVKAIAEVVAITVGAIALAVALLYPPLWGL